MTKARIAATLLPANLLAPLAYSVSVMANYASVPLTDAAHMETAGIAKIVTLTTGHRAHVMLTSFAREVLAAAAS